MAFRKHFMTLVTHLGCSCAKAHIEEELNLTQPQVAAAHQWLQSSVLKSLQTVAVYNLCVKTSDYWTNNIVT